MNTPFASLPPAQRLKKFQEQILNCRSELEKEQKAKWVERKAKRRSAARILALLFREGLTKMELVFQENPKFGDEQDVTQQIVAIDEHIEKLLAEIKRFEVRTTQTLPFLSHVSRSF